MLTGTLATCRSCKEVKDLANFSKDKNKATGYDTRCLVCLRAATKKYQESKQAATNAKRDLIRNAKSRPCADCGVEYPYYVMDLDHLPGFVKKFAVSESWTRSLAEIKEEITKCETVCANCHRIRTHNRM